MKNLICLIILTIGNFVLFSQKNCDSSTVNQIINKQLKIADKWFNEPYYLSPSSQAYDTSEAYLRADSTYNTYLCDRFLLWHNFNLDSKNCIVSNKKTPPNKNSLFISTPIFNSKKTKCRYVVSSHQGEWGGASYIYYLKRRGKKWKIFKSLLLSVS